MIFFRAPRRNFPDQRSPSTTYGFWSVLSQKNAKLPMLVDMVWGGGSRARCCGSVWGVSELCCAGFRRDFRCHPLGKSSDGSISIVDTGKSPILPKSAKIPIHLGFPEFFFILGCGMIVGATTHLTRPPPPPPAPLTAPSLTATAQPATRTK
jgi:hypothetical protein